MCQSGERHVTPVQLLLPCVAVTGCSGVADCNGVCGGKARLDWECRVCYGGDTVYKITFAGDLKDCNSTGRLVLCLQA